jgi:murein L,D-transpeptidase YcbB/YkuD
VIKFMFPNADAIYLHDTPSKKLFDRSVRAFSHGCIRVQDPLVLADVLLREQGWPLSRLEQVVAGGKPEQRIVLRNPVPIHLVYLTAFIDGGDLQFVDDIYGRDRLLVQALEANES